jgi:ATP-dependent NAD(P)H-hydrate dehydratase
MLCTPIISLLLVAGGGSLQISSTRNLALVVLRNTKISSATTSVRTHRDWNFRRCTYPFPFFFTVSQVISFPHSRLSATDHPPFRHYHRFLSFSSMGNSPSSSTYHASWDDTKLQEEALSRCILPLDEDGHKGSSGRVAVIGGSALYTGAPFYAAMASLRVGADLSYVYTAQEAVLPIKCYSPELMVQAIYCASEFDRVVLSIQKELKLNEVTSCQDRIGKEDTTFHQRMYDAITTNHDAQVLVQNMISAVERDLTKLHAMVIGPGLGRCPLVLYAVSQIIRRVITMTSITKENSLGPRLVLDADALYLLSLLPYRNLLVDSKRIIITPNVVEWHRLLAIHVPESAQSAVVTKFNVGNNSDKSNHDNVDEEGDVDYQLPAALVSLTIVKKGWKDTILFNTHNAGGVLKRPETSQGEAADSTTVAYVCTEEGGLKRSGGLGDILAGTVATLSAWDLIMHRNNDNNEQDAPTGVDKRIKMDKSDIENDEDDAKDDLAVACWTACCFVKRATKDAFDQHGRSMTAPDVLATLGPAVMSMAIPPISFPNAH